MVVLACKLSGAHGLVHAQQDALGRIWGKSWCKSVSLCQSGNIQAGVGLSAVQNSPRDAV